MKFRYTSSDTTTVSGKAEAVEYDETKSNGKTNKQFF
jgi:hypothetical protein